MVMNEMMFDKDAIQSSLADWNQENVQIIPMSSKYIGTEDLPSFLFDIVPKRGYTYHFRNKIEHYKGTLALFQYKGAIRGHAVISDIVLNNMDGGFRGSYLLYPQSIVYYADHGIDASALRSIYPYFRNFNQSPQRFDKKLVDHLSELLGGQRICINVPDPCYPDEVSENDGYLEGSASRIIVNSYERNKEARRCCIEHYKSKDGGRVLCQICGFDFGRFYGSCFDGIIHVHHVREISSIGREYVVDPIHDLIPVCPNCHSAIHSRDPPYSIEEMRAKIHMKGI